MRTTTTRILTILVVVLAMWFMVPVVSAEPPPQKENIQLTTPADFDPIYGTGNAPTSGHVVLWSDGLLILHVQNLNPMLMQHAGIGFYTIYVATPANGRVLAGHFNTTGQPASWNGEGNGTNMIIGVPFGGLLTEDVTVEIYAETDDGLSTPNGDLVLEGSINR